MFVLPGRVKIEGAFIEIPDVPATNGVIQVVNSIVEKPPPGGNNPPYVNYPLKK